VLRQRYKQVSRLAAKRSFAFNATQAGKHAGLPLQLIANGQLSVLFNMFFMIIIIINLMIVVIARSKMTKQSRLTTDDLQLTTILDCF
jgi:hypothetical protein